MTKKLNQKALAYCSRLLKIKSRSSQELQDKLNLKGYNSQDIDEVLDYLKELNEVNDELFAKCWVEDRMQLNPKAPRALHLELEKKGISKDIIDKTLLNLSKEYDLDNLALRLAQEHLATFNSDTKPEIAKKRIFNYLSHRGFEGEIIYEVIEELF
jgi:regulatory protein